MDIQKRTQIKPQSLKDKNVLLQIRLLFYFVNIVHLSYTAVYLHLIDFTKSEYVEVREYDHVRWKLITTWFNLVTFPYVILALYSDFKEYRNEHQESKVVICNRIRHDLFSNILMPMTAFSDVFFWCLWTRDRELIAPRTVDTLVPFWSQHSLHTVSMLAVLLDLLLVPRKRPRSLRPGVLMLTAFYVIYISVLLHSLVNGVYVYPLLKKVPFPVFIAFIYFGVMFWYLVQWNIVDLFWGRHNKIDFKLSISRFNVLIMKNIQKMYSYFDLNGQKLTA